MTWHINSLVQLHWRSWDGAWVVFDVGSGHTHHMNTLSAATLMVLEAGAADLSTLLVLLADELLLPNSQALSVAVTDILGNLETAGLIESAAA